MASQLTFFRKNWADFERGYVVVTSSQTSGLEQNILDRSNRTSWATSGSVDADNTTLTVDMVDVGTIDSLLLINHNFKNFLIEYWDDGSSVYVTLSNKTNVTDSTTYLNFSTINTSKFRITISNTQVANSDKTLSQFIATSKLGKLTGWPLIQKPTLSRNLVEQAMLSGKRYILQNVGFYSVTLNVSNWSLSTDLAIVESLFNSAEGFLFWPSGGDESQFSSVRQGYRLQDIYLVRCKSEFVPEWAYGLYKSGQKHSIDLVEVTT